MSNRALTWAFAQSTGNPARKAVLVALADMADEADSCWPTQATLARMTDQSERSVRDHLAVLEEAGFVRRSRRRDAAGHRTSDRYVLAVSVAVSVTNRQISPVANPAAGDQSLPADSVAPTGKSRQVTLKNPHKKISTSPAAPRPDVERLCTMLADRIEANGSKRPTIGERWRDACRLMIDVDKREPEKIARAIDWCQADEFWRANILSMPKLRTKYDQLRLAAQRAARPAAVRDFDAERKAAALERQRARFATVDRLAGAR